MIDYMHQLEQTVDKTYREFAHIHHIPGYSFGVLLGGKLIHSGSFGYIDLEQKIPATTHSIFRIASMTKSFTAMAILQLRDGGKLRLDDPVHHYLPELEHRPLTKDAPPITMRDLLIHTAGFPTDDPWADRKLAMTEEDFIMFINQGLFSSTSPETTFEYSNLGYALLGLIIKKVTGISYGKWIEEQIWKKLGVEGYWEYTKVSPSLLAQGYRWIEGIWKKEELLHDGIFGAMGGMLSSVESFSHYVAFHLSANPARDDRESGPLKRSSLREMQQPKILSDLDSAYVSGYGYGLNWKCDFQKRVYVGHGGGLPGFGSNWMIMPEYGLGLILLTNLTYAPASKINLELLHKLVTEADLKPRVLQPSKILTERKKELIGLLPDWERAEASGIFAENFFLDHPIALLKKETLELFSGLGKIISSSDLIAENALRGSFIMKGERGELRVSFSLTPENPPLIQHCNFKYENL